LSSELVEALRRKLRAVTREAVPFDAAFLEDDVALLTDWTPASGGGANFATHRLVSRSPSRVEFRATRTVMAFSLAFIIIGLVVIVVGLATAVSWDAPLGPTPTGLASSTGLDASADWASPSGLEWVLLYLGPVLFGGAFTGVGGAMFYFQGAPSVFDKRRGEYWKGRTAPHEMVREPTKNYAKLDRVHALQIVSEHCHSDDASYYSHELNLVLEDGSRLNVVDHGNGELLRGDARTLGDFLGKPVWDASVGS